MNNKEAAVFYLEALKEDVHRAANKHYFRSEFICYRDLSIREAQLTTALHLIENRFAAVPVDEPSDEELIALAADAA